MNYLKNQLTLAAAVVFLSFAVFLCLFSVRCAGAAASREIEGMVETLEVGRPVYYENLTIIPVYNPKAKDRASYTTLDEALTRGWLEITESGGGTVPRLRVANRTHHPIFIMGGEILSGGKQDRIVERDVLIGAYSRNVNIPVYCTEQGRWTDQTSKFYSKSNLGTWSMRSTAQKADSGAQHSIWSDISSSSNRMGIKSRTSAYQAMYDDSSVRSRIYEHERHFQNIPSLGYDTVGVVIGVGGDIVSVDIFTNADLFRKVWPKILKSAALSAVSHSRYGSISEQDAVRILRQIHDADYTRRGAVDQGVEFSAYNNGVNANALTHHGAVLHLAGFPAQEIRPVYQPYQDNYYSPERRMPVTQQRYWR